YTELDAEAENEIFNQKNMHNNGFIIKPPLHMIDKELVNHGNHLSPARIGTPSGRRPGRP
ncbi:14766_t:CDS:2, partial [Acaulospora morrowiae]